MELAGSLARPSGSTNRQGLELRQVWFEQSNERHEREQHRGGRNEDQSGNLTSRLPRTAAIPAMRSPATMSCATPATYNGAWTTGPASERSVLVDQKLDERRPISNDQDEERRRDEQPERIAELPKASPGQDGHGRHEDQRAGVHRDIDLRNEDAKLGADNAQDGHQREGRHRRNDHPIQELRARPYGNKRGRRSESWVEGARGSETLMCTDDLGCARCESISKRFGGRDDDRGPMSVHAEVGARPASGAIRGAWYADRLSR